MLAALGGVVAVETAGDLVRLKLAEADAAGAVAESIVQAAVAGDWALYHVAPDAPSLEDVFLQLTQLEEAV